MPELYSYFCSEEAKKEGWEVDSPAVMWEKWVKSVKYPSQNSSLVTNQNKPQKILSKNPFESLIHRGNPNVQEESPSRIKQISDQHGLNDPQLGFPNLEERTKVFLKIEKDVNALMLTEMNQQTKSMADLIQELEKYRHNQDLVILNDSDVVGISFFFSLPKSKIVFSFFF